MKKQNILIKKIDSKTELSNKKSLEAQFRILVSKITQVKTSFLKFIQNSNKSINVQQFFNKSNKVQAQLLINFENQINIILQNLTRIHQCSTNFQSDSNLIIKSTVKTTQLNQTLYNINQLQFEDLYQLNLQLTQQNQKYEKQLQEAECQIKKLQQCNHIYLAEINWLKTESVQNKNLLGNRTEISYNDQLQAQNQQLKLDLAEAQQFISKNNEQFVRELQKYNQKIWKLQKQTQSIRVLLHQTENQLDQQTTLVNKLRQQNVQLQILARNLKNLMLQETNDGNTTDLKYNGHMSERPRQNKLRQFFKQKIHEGLSKRL